MYESLTAEAAVGMQFVHIADAEPQRSWLIVCCTGSFLNGRICVNIESCFGKKPLDAEGRGWKHCVRDRIRDVQGCSRGPR